MTTPITFPGSNDVEGLLVHTIPSIPEGPTGPMSKSDLQAMSAPVVESRQAAAITSAINAITSGVLFTAKIGINTSYSHGINNHPFKNCIFTDAMIASICDGVKAVYHDSNVISTNTTIHNDFGLIDYVITVSWA
jgi:hypothetical protein